MRASDARRCGLFPRASDRRLHGRQNRVPPLTFPARVRSPRPLFGGRPPKAPFPHARRPAGSAARRKGQSFRPGSPYLARRCPHPAAPASARSAPHSPRPRRPGVGISHRRGSRAVPASCRASSRPFPSFPAFPACPIPAPHAFFRFHRPRGMPPSLLLPGLLPILPDFLSPLPRFSPVSPAPLRRHRFPHPLSGPQSPPPPRSLFPPPRPAHLPPPFRCHPAAPASAPPAVPPPLRIPPPRPSPAILEPRFF